MSRFSSDLLERIRCWPFYLRVPAGYLVSTVFAGLYASAPLWLLRAGLGPLEFLETGLLLGALILVLGIPVLIIATVIGEFFEVRAFGFYVLVSIFNSVLVGLILIFKARNSAPDLRVILEFVVSPIGIYTILGGLITGSLYWFVAGRFARRSWRFGAPQPKGMTPEETERWRLY
jgi:hypothetical protein